VSKQSSHEVEAVAKHQTTSSISFDDHTHFLPHTIVMSSCNKQMTKLTKDAGASTVELKTARSIKIETKGAVDQKP
jgi:hypothetical protein